MAGRVVASRLTSRQFPSQNQAGRRRSRRQGTRDERSVNEPGRRRASNSRGRLFPTELAFFNSLEREFLPPCHFYREIRAAAKRPELLRCHIALSCSCNRA